VTQQGRTVDRVYETHRAALIAVPGVTGTAIGTCDGSPCIRVFVANRGVLDRNDIPGTLEGILVKIEVSGTFEPR
jgi:hypothetical protein